MQEHVPTLWLLPCCVVRLDRLSSRWSLEGSFTAVAVLPQFTTNGSVPLNSTAALPSRITSIAVDGSVSPAVLVVGYSVGLGAAAAGLIAVLELVPRYAN